MKKLIIVDLEKNYTIQRTGCSYLFVNRGSITFKDSLKINFNINNNKKIIKNNKKDLINYFLKIKEMFEHNYNKVNTSELEIFNLRNDKYNYLDKILVFYTLKKRRYNDKYKLEIITDNSKCKKFYQSVFGKKIHITNLSEHGQPKNEYSLLFFRYLKFILRAFYFLILIKIFKTNKVLNKKSDFFLSLYPYFFQKKNMSLYSSKQKNFINFSLTDETHLNLSPIKYLKHVKELSQLDRVISIEKFIKFRELFSSLKRFYFEYGKVKYLFKKNFFFQGINCTDLILSHIKGSFLNRSKLFIYEKTLNTFFEKYQPKKFHYFLFEYNFGFFLKNQFKKVKKFIGYQHGIYTKNLMWLDLINSKKMDYLPDTIICNQKMSKSVYNKKFKKIIFMKKKNNFDKKIKINNNYLSTILVYPGQHDINDCIYYFLNNKKFKDKKIFFKLHPNNKIKIIMPSENFYLINKVNTNIKFNIYLSPTTTIIYDLLNKNSKFNIIKFNYRVNLWG